MSWLLGIEIRSFAWTDYFRGLLALAAATAQLSSAQSSIEWFSLGTQQADTVPKTILFEKDLTVGKLNMSHGEWLLQNALLLFLEFRFVSSIH